MWTEKKTEKKKNETKLSEIIRFTCTRLCSAYTNENHMIDTPSASDRLFGSSRERTHTCLQPMCIRTVHDESMSNFSREDSNHTQFSRDFMRLKIANPISIQSKVMTLYVCAIPFDQFSRIVSHFGTYSLYRSDSNLYVYLNRSISPFSMVAFMMMYARLLGIT